MREKICRNTVTVGGVTFVTGWERKVVEPVCDQIDRQYRRNPDMTIVHERCDDATCEICNRVFGGKK